MAEATYNEIKFTDDDVVQFDDWIPNGKYNPHHIHPWLLHDYGFVLCVVFAANLQDALDIAVDEDKLDRYQVDPYPDPDYPDDEGISFLGNASEPFDIESLGIVELPNPENSFCTLFASQFQTVKESRSDASGSVTLKGEQWLELHDRNRETKCQWCKKERPDTPGICPHCYRFPTINPEWKQSTPVKQLMVILMRMEGNLSNQEEGIIEVEKYNQRTQRDIEELRRLEPYLEKGSWDD